VLTPDAAAFYAAEAAEAIREIHSLGYVHRWVRRPRRRFKSWHLFFLFFSTGFGYGGDAVHGRQGLQ
jgi:hypothetical protein